MRLRHGWLNRGEEDWTRNESPVNVLAKVSVCEKPGPRLIKRYRNLALRTMNYLSAAPAGWLRKITMTRCQRVQLIRTGAIKLSNSVYEDRCERCTGPSCRVRSKAKEHVRWLTSNRKHRCQPSKPSTSTRLWFYTQRIDFERNVWRGCNEVRTR